MSLITYQTRWCWGQGWPPSVHDTNEQPQLPYVPRDLNLTYEPDKSWAHFVLYTGPKIGIAGAALNATARIEHQSRYVSSG